MDTNTLYMLKKATLILFSITASFASFGQAGGLTCADAEPICSDAGFSFTANAGGPNASTLDPGNDYGCLASTPNPSWYFLEIDQPGDIIMSLSAPSDVDFIIWGPYSDLAAATAACGNHNNIVPDENCGFFGGCDSYGCSFSASNTETPGIANAQSGDVYVMLVTNYANTVQDITLVQTGGSGSTNCDILVPCTIDPDAGADTEICFGDSHTLNGSFTDEVGNTTVTWTSNPANAVNDLSDPNSLTPVFTPSQAYGNVTFTLTVDDDGLDDPCSNQDDVIINVIPLPTEPTVTANGPICVGDNGVFSIVGGANQTVTYSLDGGATTQTVTLDGNGQSNVTVSGMQSDTTILITDVASGICTETFNVTATVIVDLSGNIPTIINPIDPFCEGDPSASFSATPIGGTWSGPGIVGASSGVFDPTVAGVGNHVITYTPPGSCSDPATVVVSVNPTPDAVITGGGDTVLVDTPVDLTADTVFAYLWEPSEYVSCEDCQTTTVLPPETTTFTLTVENQFGCQDTASTIVYIEYPCDGAFLPTMFSPNDDELNDEFCVLTTPECVITMDLRIYNRWGELMFSTGQYEECWDGTFKGEPVNNGAYVYIFEATLKDGTKIEEKGNINVVR